MSTCPEGHASQSDDYCDVCGSPIDDPANPAPAAPTPTASAPGPSEPKSNGVACPNCQSENVPDALFCEACGYDFTTGTMPRPWVSPFAEDDSEDDAAPVVEPSPEPVEPSPEPVEPTPEPVEPTPGESPDLALDGPSATPALSPVETADISDDASAPPSAHDEPPTTSAPAPVDPVGTSVDTSVDTSDDTSAPPAATDEPPGPPTAAPAETVETSDAPSGPLAGMPLDSRDEVLEDEAPEEDPFAWVAELWVDPDWYRHQEPPDPMPSPGLPEVVPLQKRSVLVGRPSRSRGIHPDIDCDSDPGASRRQAQLTTDGRRWWVEDLDSSNGTYVAGAAEGLPARPIPVGQRRELDPDDRIYLGAWSRLVIRRATDEERETFSP